jgi:hypothetical protein
MWYPKLKVPEILDDYYCDDCKSWFDYPVIHQWEEPRGEFWGIPCSEPMCERLCPNCGSEEIYEADELEVEEEDEDEE